MTFNGMLHMCASARPHLHSGSEGNTMAACKEVFASDHDLCKRWGCLCSKSTTDLALFLIRRANAYEEVSVKDTRTVIHEEIQYLIQLTPVTSSLSMAVQTMGFLEAVKLRENRPYEGLPSSS